MQRFLVVAFLWAASASAPAACLSQTQGYPAGLSPRGLAVADFDGDGFADVAVANFGSSAYIGVSGPASQGSISLFWGSNSGLQNGPTLALPNDAPRGLAEANFGGGALLLVSLYKSGRLAVYPYGGAKAFGAPAYYPVGKFPVAVASQVFGAQIWVAVADFGSNSVHLFTASAGVLKPAGVLTGFSGPTDVKFYASAKAKNLLLLVTDFASSSLGRVTLNPDATVQAETTTSMAGGPAKIAVGDLSGDGNLDAAVSCFSGGTVNVFWGQADGSLGVSATAISLQGSHPSGMAFATLCGRPSLVVADRDSDALELVSSTAGVLGASVFSLTAAAASVTGTAVAVRPVEVAAGAVTAKGQNALVVTEMGLGQVLLVPPSLEAVSKTALAVPALPKQGTVTVIATATIGAPGLVIAPNPAAGYSQASYRLNRPGQATLLLYTMAGQRVELFDLGYREPGSYQERLDLRGLASGIYFALLTQSGERGQDSIVARFKLALLR